MIIFRACPILLLLSEKPECSHWLLYLALLALPKSWLQTEGDQDYAVIPAWGSEAAESQTSLKSLLRLPSLFLSFFFFFFFFLSFFEGFGSMLKRRHFLMFYYSMFLFIQHFCWVLPSFFMMIYYIFFYSSLLSWNSLIQVQTLQSLPYKVFSARIKNDHGCAHEHYASLDASYNMHNTCACYFILNVWNVWNPHHSAAHRAMLGWTADTCLTHRPAS